MTNDSKYLWLVSGDSLYRYLKEGSQPVLDTAVEICSLLVDVAVSENRVVVACDSSYSDSLSDTLHIIILDKGDLAQLNEVRVPFRKPQSATEASIEFIGDSLYIARKYREHSWKVDKYRLVNDTLVYLYSWGDTITSDVYAPWLTLSRNGLWASSNSYECTKVFRRRPDGGILDFTDIGHNCWGIDVDTQRIRFYVGVTFPSSEGYLMAFDWGDTASQSTALDFKISDIRLWRDTLFVKPGSGSLVYLVDPHTLEIIRPISLSGGGTGMDIAGDSGYIFTTCCADSTTFVKVYNRSGGLVAMIANMDVCRRPYHVSVDDEVFPWRLYVTMNLGRWGNTVTMPLYVYEVNPYNWEWELVDSVGDTLYKSVFWDPVYGHWGWHPTIDTMYMLYPDHFVIADAEPSGSKILISDIFNRRMVVHLLPVNHRSDDVKATAYPQSKHLIRVPNSDTLHLVYESQGNVYYHFSPDAGKTWYPPKRIDDAEMPSIYSRSSNRVDLVYVRNDTMYYAGFDPDYVIEKRFILGTREGMVRNPVVTRILKDEDWIIHVIYEGVLNGSRVLSHAVYDVGGHPDSSNTVIDPEEHHVISYPGGMEAHPSVAVDVVYWNLHVVWQDSDEIYYSKFDGNSWSQPENISKTSGNQSEFPYIESYGDSLFVSWAEECDPGNFDIWKKRENM